MSDLFIFVTFIITSHYARGSWKQCYCVCNILVCANLQYCNMMVSLWNNPEGWFCWFGHLSGSVDPFISTHTQLRGEFHRLNKYPPPKKTTNRGRKKKQTNMDSEQQNVRRWNLALFRILHVFVICDYHENSVKIRHGYQKCRLISGHCLHSSVSFFLTAKLSILALTALNPCLRADCQLHILGLNVWLLWFSLLTWPIFLVLSSSLAGSHGHNSLCQMRQRKVF